MQASGGPGSAAASRWRKARRLIFLFAVVPQVLVLLAQPAAAFLLRDAPLLLLAMHPFQPWALLVSPKVGWASFASIIVACRGAAYFGDYFIGRWYGERGLRWLRARRSTAKSTQVVEWVFARMGGVLLVLYPGLVVSVLAGATGMRFRRFASLILLGLVLWASVLRLIGSAAAGPLTEIASFVERYAWSFVIPLTALAGAIFLRESRRSLRVGPEATAAELRPPPRETAAIRVGEDGGRPAARAREGGEREGADHQRAGADGD